MPITYFATGRDEITRKRHSAKHTAPVYVGAVIKRRIAADGAVRELVAYVSRPDLAQREAAAWTRWNDEKHVIAAGTRYEAEIVPVRAYRGKHDAEPKDRGARAARAINRLRAFAALACA